MTLALNFRCPPISDENASLCSALIQTVINSVAAQQRYFVILIEEYCKIWQYIRYVVIPDWAVEAQGDAKQEKGGGQHDKMVRQWITATNSSGRYLELERNIHHLNPWRAGLMKDLDGLEESLERSAVLLGNRIREGQDTSEVLTRVGKNKSCSLPAYRLNEKEHADDKGKQYAKGRIPN